MLCCTDGGINVPKKNLVKFLLKTHSDFFKIKDGSFMALQDDIE